MLSAGGEGLDYLLRHGLAAEAALFRSNLGTELYLEEDGRSKVRFERYERNVVEWHANLYEADVDSLGPDGSTEIAAHVARMSEVSARSLEVARRAREEFCSQAPSPVAASGEKAGP